MAHPQSRVTTRVTATQYSTELWLYSTYQRMYYIASYNTVGIKINLKKKTENGRLKLKYTTDF